MSLNFALGHKDCENFGEFFDVNITHNLGEMANKAGIYEALWRPYRLHKDWSNTFEGNYEEESEFEKNANIKAKEIIEILEEGLIKLKEDEEYYKKFNASNGWGIYKHFVPFVEKVLEACKKYSNAIIGVSR